VLAVLASRPGELVTREEIRKAIWGADTWVNFDQGLSATRVIPPRSSEGSHEALPAR
jgi:DNA-binding response OmpR family regulator